MCDYDGPEAYVEAHPLARKEHRCCECRGVINPGEKYHKVTGVWDHQGKTFKTCSDCEALRSEVAKANDGCWVFGGLTQDITDSFREDPADRHAFYRILKKRNPESLHRFSDWALTEPNNQP